MIKLDKDYIRCLVKKAPQRKNVSAWKNGVKNYALWLIDELPDDYCMIFDNRAELKEQLKIFTKLLLNGADNWWQYSYYGNAYCYDNDIPCLGICAGQNNIARGLGGTIKCVNNPDFHNRPNDQYVHNINIIDKNSKIFNIIKKDNIKVNSRHKNVLDSYPLLKVTAVDEDGYPDVVESENKKFYIGVRFHPESLYKIDTNMNNIFRYFIDQCKKNK